MGINCSTGITRGTKPSRKKNVQFIHPSSVRTTEHVRSIRYDIAFPSSPVPYRLTQTANGVEVASRDRGESQRDGEPGNRREYCPPAGETLPLAETLSQAANAASAVATPPRGCTPISGSAPPTGRLAKKPFAPLREPLDQRVGDPPDHSARSLTVVLGSAYDADPYGEAD